MERAGRAISTPIDGLTHLFPSPVALMSANLGGLGLTGGRIDAIKKLASAVVEGKVDFSVTAEDVVGQLTSIRGIGPWTAQYVALRALGEPDAFPSTDLVLRRVASDTHRTLSPSRLEARLQAWRPWRAYAVIYLWTAALEVRARVAARQRTRADACGLQGLRYYGAESRAFLHFVSWDFVAKNFSTNCLLRGVRCAPATKSDVSIRRLT